MSYNFQIFRHSLCKRSKQRELLSQGFCSIYKRNKNLLNTSELYKLDLGVSSLKCRNGDGDRNSEWFKVGDAQPGRFCIYDFATSTGDPFSFLVAWIH